MEAWRIKQKWSRGGSVDFLSQIRIDKEQDPDPHIGEESDLDPH